jgi:hypothetical protein
MGYVASVTLCSYEASLDITFYSGDLHGHTDIEDTITQWLLIKRGKQRCKEVELVDLKKILISALKYANSGLLASMFLIHSDSDWLLVVKCVML